MHGKIISDFFKNKKNNNNSNNNNRYNRDNIVNGSD